MCRFAPETEMNMWDVILRFGWFGAVVFLSLGVLCALTLWTVVRKPDAGATRIIAYDKGQLVTLRR